MFAHSTQLSCICKRFYKYPELSVPISVPDVLTTLGKAPSYSGPASQQGLHHGSPRNRPTSAASFLPTSFLHAIKAMMLWGCYHGVRRPSSDDSLHSPTVIPPSALDKPSIMKCYHRRRTCSHTSSRRSPTMVTLHDNRFAECRW